MNMPENSTDFADLADATLGDIAVALPGAAAAFRAAGLDYCCGGQMTLKNAAAAKSIDPERIIAVLRELNQDKLSAPADIDTKTLIDSIITRYHRVHSKELPELIQMAERVEAVHRGHGSVPAGLAALLKQVLGDLTVHMQKEELVLFPRMNNGGAMPLHSPITTMMAEHQEHGAYLEEIRNLTHNLEVPADGCATWRALYAGIAKFADDLIDHIHTENNILFPRFREDAA